MEISTPTPTMTWIDGVHRSLQRDSSTLKRGSNIDRYVLLGCLGRGGMGVVYAAWDSKLDRRVALKLLRPDRLVGGVEDVHARLQAEARTLAQLSHPHVVTVYDVGHHDGRVFVAMEFIEGVSLSEWLAEQPRSWSEVVARFRDAANGLAAVHRAGLVHRDVKPRNLMVGADGRVRVVDFGLAQQAASDSAVGETHGRPISTTVGTPAYMAPEQYHSGIADERSDQFSFCGSLFYALYGELPFGSGDAARIRLRIENHHIAEPRGSRVPSWLHQVVIRGLSAKPEDRFTSMDDLLTALSRDPAAQRWRWGIALGALILLITVFSTAYQQRAEAALLCRGAVGKVEGVWSPERQNALKTTFLSVDQPYSARSWQYVEQSLDRYLDDWAKMHVEVCEATRLRGEQSESLMDLRIACLEDRLQEVGTATDVLARSGQEAIARSASVVDALSSLLPCADTVTLTSLEPLPQDATIRLKIDQVRARVAHGKTMTDIGQPEAALPVLEESVVAANEAGYRPLIARAVLRLAEAHGRLGRMDRTEALLWDALESAIEGYDQRTIAMVWLDFVIVGWYSARFEAAERWARVAEAAIDRLDDIELRAALQHRIGMLHNRQGRFDEAIEHFQASIELKKQTLPPDAPTIGNSISNMGISYRRLGRYEDALKNYQQSLAMLERTYGEVHPDRASTWSNIGLAYAAMGEPHQALSSFEQSLAIYQQLPGPPHNGMSSCLEGLGETYLDLGEPKLAIEVLERSLAMRIEYGVDPKDIASTRFNLARAIRSSAAGPQDTQRARELALEARNSYVELGPRAEEDIKTIDSWLVGENP